jgi:hypothetical protein
MNCDDNVISRHWNTKSANDIIIAIHRLEWLLFLINFKQLIIIVLIQK